jgi:hypothetical protein
VHQTRHAGGAAGGDDLLRQLDVGAREVGTEGRARARVQHADGVDHRVRVLEQARERGGVVHIGFDDVGVGQQQHVTGAATPASGNEHLDACFAQAVGDGAADKTGAADDDDTFRIHAWTLGR